MPPDAAWILTHSRRRFRPLAPRARDVHIGDIAHSLARTQRFGGHIEHCSVAKHSIYVALLSPPRHARWGLLHDAAEAYLGDLSDPIKQRIPEFQAAEMRVLSVIAERYNLALPIPWSVRRADHMACLAEARRGWEDPHVTDDWAVDALPPPFDPLPDVTPPSFWELRFLEACDMISSPYQGHLHPLWPLARRFGLPRLYFAPSTGAEEWRNAKLPTMK